MKEPPKWIVAPAMLPADERLEMAWDRLHGEDIGRQIDAAGRRARADAIVAEWKAKAKSKVDAPRPPRHKRLLWSR